MTCTDVRARLPGFLYGELGPQEAAAVEHHLARCPACRHELAGLGQVRRALDRLPSPDVRVDLPLLYRQAAGRQDRRARRWRRAALALGAVAALLLVWLGLHLEVRVEANQLVLRWGPPPPGRAEPGERRETPPAVQPPPAEVEERLRVMNALIHALADDVESRDAQQRQNLARLEQRLDLLNQLVSYRWNETQQSVAALYAAQRKLTTKEEKR